MKKPHQYSKTRYPAEAGLTANVDMEELTGEKATWQIGATLTFHLCSLLPQVKIHCCKEMVPGESLNTNLDSISQLRQSATLGWTDCEKTMDPDEAAI